MKTYKPYFFRFGLVASQIILFFLIRNKDYSGLFLVIFSMNGLLGVILSNSSADTLEKSNSDQINIHISIFEITSAVALTIYNLTYLGIVGITSLFIIPIAPLETYLKGYNKQHQVYFAYILINIGCLFLTHNEYILLYFFGLKLFALLLLTRRLEIITQITKTFKLQRLYINRQNIINHLIGLDLSSIPKGLVYKIYTSIGNSVSVYLNVRNFENYNTIKNQKAKHLIKIFLNLTSIILILFTPKNPLLFPLIIIIQAYVSYVTWTDSWGESTKNRNILFFTLIVIFSILKLNLLIALLLAELIYELWIWIIKI